MRAYAAQLKASGNSQAGEAPFFANRDGTPLAARTVSKAFAQLRQAAWVCRESEARYQPRLHDLRHYLLYCFISGKFGLVMFLM